MGYGHENLVTDLFLGAENHAAIRKTLSPSVSEMQIICKIKGLACHAFFDDFENFFGVNSYFLVKMTLMTGRSERIIALSVQSILVINMSDKGSMTVSCEKKMLKPARVEAHSKTIKSKNK